MAARHRPVRPDGIEFWVDDRPPPATTWMLALQQVAFLGAIMTLPVVLGRAAGLDPAGEAGLVALTMITAGIGVILQAMNRYGVGIGLFSPLHTSSVAFPAALAAVEVGGLGLAFGMMSVAGLVQMVASRLVPRLRGLFPVEIAGLTVLVLGLGLGMVGLRNFLALDTPVQASPPTLAVGGFTLAVIIGLNIWTRGRLRAFSVVSGLIAGQIAAVASGFTDHFAAVQAPEVPLFAVPPVGHFGWDFDWAFVPEFVIVGLALSFNCFGVLTVAQRANDAAWKRPDMEGIGRGLMAEGLTNVAGSLVNGVTQTASGGAIGLAQASGNTSRVVAYALGALFIGLAFVPPVAAFWTQLAAPVIGAVLLFVASFIIVGGIKITTSRLLDARKTLVIGLALLAGLSHDGVLAELGAPPRFLEPLLATTVSLTVLVALLLNAVLRLGVHRSVSQTVSLRTADWAERTNAWVWRIGHQWGARPEVVRRLDHATHELLDNLAAHDMLSDPTRTVTLTARFDEYECRLQASYTGEELVIPARRPDPETLLTDPHAVHALAGYLIRRQADAVRVEPQAGQWLVTLVFND